MNKHRWWMMLVVVALLAGGCASVKPGAPATIESDEGVMMGGAMPEALPMEAAPPEAARVVSTNGAIDAVGDLPDRMIIYNGSLSLVVDDTLTTAEKVTTMVQQWDGYVASSDSYAIADGLMRVEMSLRVPAEHFNEAMNALRALSDDIRQDSISSSDVTEEYVDLDSRLRALEAKADRLTELMDRAEDTEAVLAVYRELSATEQEIERVKGRMRYLERHAAMGSIDVTLIPRESEKPIEIGGWEPKGVVKHAVQALIDTYHVLATVVIWLVIYGLPMALLAWLLFLIIRWLCRRLLCRKRKARAKATTPPPSPSP